MVKFFFTICLFLYQVNVGLASQTPFVLDTMYNTNPKCFGNNDGTATVVVSGGSGSYSYSWSHAPFLNSDYATGLSSGTYSVTVTDGLNTVIGNTTLYDPEELLVGASRQDAGCGTNNGSIQASSNYDGTPRLVYHWSTSPSYHGDFLEELYPGSYSVWVTQGVCTSDTVSVTIYDLGSPTIDVWDTLSILLGNNIVIYQSHTPGEHISLSWSPDADISCLDCSFPTVQPDETSVYYCTIYDSVARCTAYDSCIVTVKAPSYFATCPNTFSPNGDFKNDVFYLRGYGIAEMEMRVFDRNGAVVFYSENINLGWDGTLENMPLNPGVFVYTVSGSYINDEKFFIKGNITLIR